VSLPPPRVPSRARLWLRALLALSACAGAIAGCSGSHTPSADALRARRADLVQVGRALTGLRAPLASELSVARRAWPLIDRWLERRHSVRRAHRPGGQSASAPEARRATLAARDATLAQAAALARALPATLVSEPEALTGAASGIASIYQLASGLLAHGWEQVAAAASTRGHDPAALAFLRANANTYIIAIYDAHFDLSLLGKQFSAAYKRLGGASAFGRAFTAAQARSIARAYSPRYMRLRPHPWRALVSG
jgi:hypothetical protein